MEAEIISIGTEIILGQIVNTNARFLADQLRQLDIDAHWQTTTDDDPKHIQAAIKLAQKRAQLIFICGGLGPTPDDQTMASTAAAIGVELALDNEQWQKIQADFIARKTKMMPENIKMAYYLKGGQVLSNPTGMAIGAYLNHQEHTYVVLPGPPREFKPMVIQSLLPLLRQQFSNGKAIYSHNLHFLGLPESQLMDEIEQSLNNAGLDDVLATSYVQPGEIQVRLTIRDVTRAQAIQRLDEAKRAVVKHVGQYCFGIGEDITLAGQVVKLLQERHWTITGAESLTGGMFQSMICSVPGASKVFNGGFVTYAAQAKVQLLDVPQAVVDRYGVVSAQTARAMAEGCQKKMGAEVGISFTGVAGPDDLEGQPAGTVWIGIAIKDQPTQTKQLHLSRKMATRQWIRQRSVQMGLLFTYWALQNKTN
ncbi:competence/damage-inducible protein A [Limosilactobacillus mucosae]|uniref:competence/damage-inducible protein A n=1 Tax=Limosilactobacillus mucosae TaxID=97478 RepID=UPI0039911BCD